MSPKPDPFPPPPEASIRDAWATFSGIAIPADAGDGQREAMHTAFYSGAMVALGLTLRAVNRNDKETVQSLSLEVREFAKGWKR